MRFALRKWCKRLKHDNNLELYQVGNVELSSKRNFRNTNLVAEFSVYTAEKEPGKAAESR